MEKTKEHDMEAGTFSWFTAIRVSNNLRCCLGGVPSKDFNILVVYAGA